MEGRHAYVTPLITAAAVVTALGHDLETTWQGLMRGESGIRPVTRFDPSPYVSGVAACVPGLDAHPPGRSRLHQLLDLLFADFPAVPEHSLLLAATTKGGIDALEAHGRGIPSDLADLPLARLCEATRNRLGLDDPGVVLSAACASSTMALGRAAAAIVSGRAQSVLVVCLDLVTEFIFSGFSALRALSPAACRPFHRRRDGMSIGEAAAALLVMSPQCAAGQGLEPLARVTGWAAADDAHHLSAPDPQAGGLIATCWTALARAGLNPQHVAAICAHGTGTAYNDLMELKAYHQVFTPEPPPLFSVKGALGHAMGASGGVEAALCCLALRDRLTPPTLGCTEPEDLAQGLVSDQVQPLGPGPVLSANSGFSGINAAVILDVSREDRLEDA